MRIALCLPVLLLASASAFEVGKEYVYEYRGKLQVKNPEQPLQSTGIAFKSKVVTQPRKEHTHFKLVDLEVDHFNLDVVDIETHEFKYHSNDAFKQFAERPFAATFSEGKVESVELGKDEPLWSKNLKKGIVALFQVDLVKGRADHPHAKAYHVKEDGLGGHCDTLYLVAEEEGEIEVRKVKNFEKCEKEPFEIYGRPLGKKCVKCEATETHPISGTAEVKYDLEGTPQHYVIKHACASSDKLIAPYADGKSFFIQLNRTLHLEEVRDSTTNTDLPADIEKSQSITQSFPETGDVQTHDDLKHRNAFVSAYGLTSNKDDFVAAFKKLAAFQYNEDDVHDLEKKESAGLTFLVLFNAIAVLSYDEVSQIYEQHVANAPEGEKADLQNLFVDLLTASGTNQNVAFGLQLIKDGKLEVKQEENFFTRIPLHLKEHSSAVITELAELCSSPHVKSRRSWSNCVLSLSSLVAGDSCVRSHTDHDVDGGTCKSSLVAHFFNYSVTPADVDHQEEDKTFAYLKVAGNLATRSAVHYLERFLSQEGHQPHHRRIAAMWALKTAASRHPDLVRSIALPVYENKSEPHTLRIAAFRVFLSTRPDLYLLRYVAEEIIDEPSDQVTFYVVSLFRALAESEYPCHAEIAQHLRYVLPLWKNVRRFSREPDHTSSHVELTGGYDEKYDYGGSTMVSMIRAEDSNLARSLYISAKDYHSGFSFQNFGFSFEQWGLDKLIHQLLAPKPGSTKNLFNVMGRRRFTREASSKDRKETEDALHVKAKEFDPFYVRMTLELFGHVVDTIVFDEAHLAEFQQKAGKPEGLFSALLQEKKPQKKNFLLSKDIILMMPSEIGVPIFLDFKQVEFIYSNRAKTEFNHADDGKLTLDLKRHYVHESRGYKMVGFGLSASKKSLGTGLDTQVIMSMPLNLHVTLDPVHKTLSIKRPLSLPYNVLNIRSHPYTFAMSFDMPNNVETAVQALSQPQHPLYNKEELEQIDRHYFGDVLGYSLNVKGSLLAKGLDQGLHEFLHHMDWRQKYYYLKHNPEWHPRYLKVTIAPADKDATKEIEVEYGYKHYEPDDATRESHFPVHDAIEGDSEVPTTHVLSAEFKLKGDSKERKASTELRYSVTKDTMKHKVQFFYERDPFSSKGQEKTKVCVDVTAKFPEPDWSKLQKIATFHEGKTVKTTANVHYGSNCVDQSSISFKGTFTHTNDDEEDIQANALGKPHRLNRAKNDRLRYLYEKCAKYQKEGVLVNYYCLKYLYHTSRLGKLTQDVEYRNLKPFAPRLYKFMQKYCPYLKEHKGYFGSVMSHVSSPNGKLHVVSEVSSYGECPHATVNVTTEDGHTHTHKNVAIFSHMLEPRVFSALGYTNLREYASVYRNKHCDLQGHSVKTFDGAVVNLPSTDCFKLLAQDCSPNKAFLLLARDTGYSALSKALKLFIHDVKVEILPLAEGSGLIVRVDGSRVQVTPDVPYSHTYHNAELFEVTVNDKFYEIVSRPYGLYIGFEGNVLIFQVSNLYRGKLCGLCGDYNYDKHHDLEGPDGHIYNDTLAFAKSFVVPTKDCTPP